MSDGSDIEKAMEKLDMKNSDMENESLDSSVPEDDKTCFEQLDDVEENVRIMRERQDFLLYAVAFVLYVVALSCVFNTLESKFGGKF